MHTVILGVALGIVGWTAGWQPVKSGGMEYIIQIHPQEVETILREGSIESDVPASLKDIRRYRIVFGTETPPRITPPEKPPAPAAAPGGQAAEPPRKPMPSKIRLPGSWPSDPPHGSRKAAGPEEPLGSPKEKPPAATGQTATGKKSDATTKPAPPPLAEEPAGSRWPLGLGLGLLGSFGGNIYLGWITWETRARYRTLLRRRRHGDPAPAIDDFPE